MRLGVEGAVSLNSFGSKTWGPHLPFYMRDAVQQWEQVGNVVTVCSRKRNRQRDAVGVSQEVVLAAELAPIRGIWAGFLAPAGRSQRGAVHQSPIPVDLVGRLEF